MHRLEEEEQVAKGRSKTQLVSMIPLYPFWKSFNKNENEQVVSEQLHSHCWCPRVFLCVSLPLSKEEFHKTFPCWNMKFQGQWQDSNMAEQSLMDCNKKRFSLFPLGAPHAPEIRDTLKWP